MVRRGSPALYELMRKPGSGGGAGQGDGPQGAPRRSSPGPGLPDSFEVSLGRAAAIAAGCVLLIAIAYGIGVQRGRSLGRDPGSGDAAPRTEATAPATPSATGPGSGSMGTAGPASVQGPSGGRKSGAVDRPATDNTADPRTKGTRYFVLAHPSSERAAEMVEFCRENGLEAFLVPDDNALLRKIIVLPGYRDASEKNSPEIKALEAKIRSVGDKWKRSSRGNKDFSDAYPELHR